MATWRLVIAQLTDNKPLGELTQFSNFQYTRSLSKLATCSFQIRSDNPLMDRLTKTDVIAKLYRDTTLQFCGPVVSSEEAADHETQTVSVNCADQGWVLTKRLTGKSSTGLQFTTPTDVANIAKQLIDGTNLDLDTRISTSAVTLTSGSSRTYTAGPYRFILDCITELGSTIDGFDWRIVPVESWSNGGLISTPVGYFDAQTLIGSNKPTAIFEYGVETRANILDYKITTTRDGQATRVYHPGSSPDAPVVTNSSTTVKNTWGLEEDAITGVDITDATMRQKLTDEHIAVRETPRRILTFTPHIDPGLTGRIPRAFVDYDIGDTVTVRIVNAGKVRFAGLVRVYGVTLSVDDQGFERVNLVTEDES